MKEYIAGWLGKADHDIISAQRLIEIEPMILDYACFNCQQAVEKSLKAFLIYQNVDIEKTRDVLFLLSESAKFDPIFNTIDPPNINALAVQARYPNFNMPEAEEARALYKLAVLVSKIVKDRIVLP